MSPVMIDLLLNALGETLLMLTAVAGLFSLLAGLPLGLILVTTSPGGIAEYRTINRLLGLVINGFRSLPFIILLVALIGASAIAGSIGAGGLGDLAIRYGYQRLETPVMVAVIAVLIVLVCGIQWLGDRLVQRIDKRHWEKHPRLLTLQLADHFKVVAISY